MCKTADQQALNILMTETNPGTRQRKLQALLDATAVAYGERCPECGSTETEDNGGTEYRCCGCDPRHPEHRASPDIQKSLEQMRHYLEAWVYPEIDALLGRDSMPPQHKKRAR